MEPEEIPVNTEMQRHTTPNPQVLVAEDDVPLTNFLRRQLESEAYTVQLVQDGEAASEKINSDKYHLLILDLGLPKLDGVEVLKQIRPKQPQLPILVLTGRTQVEDRVLSTRESGAGAVSGVFVSG